jgi:hypothetical protein
MDNSEASRTRSTVLAYYWEILLGRSWKRDKRIRFIVGDLELNLGDAAMGREGDKDCGEEQNTLGQLWFRQYMRENGGCCSRLTTYILLGRCRDIGRGGNTGDDVAITWPVGHVADRHSVPTIR